MKIKAESVKAISKYKLFIVFSDGTEGVYDLSDLAGQGVFKRWDEEDNFEKVFVNQENGAITWPGEIDVDTLNAYFAIKNISPDQFFQSNKYASNF